MDLIETKVGSYFRHPWEIARASCILNMIPHNLYYKILDVGAGDLYFLELFRKSFPGNAVAVDSKYGENLKNKEGITLLKSIDEIPPNTVDICFLMDVLEHATQDRFLLVNTINKVRPGGLIVITVPAYPSLFSPHDIFLKHIRRYSRTQLMALTSGLNISIIEYFSFFTIPLIIRTLQITFWKLRFYRFKNEGVGIWPYGPTNWFTRSIVSLLKMDFFLNRYLNRFGFPSIGLSLCMLLQKK